MITLYLDMDGVLADFNKEYVKHDYDKNDKTRFRTAVLEHSIFEKLDFMPDTQQLLNHVTKLKNVKIEILTSVGTFDLQQGSHAQIQKFNWLEKKNIPYPINFVRTKSEKAKYATSSSILIDDSVGCIAPFIEAGGHGILHVNASDTIRILDATLTTLNDD